MLGNDNTLAPFAVAVVTGGSSGIGKSFIRLVGELSPGVRIFNLSRSEPDEKFLHSHVHHVPCDLSKAEERARGGDEAVRFIRQQVHRPKVLLINNAGIGSYGIFPAAGAAEQDRLVTVNIAAMVDLTARLLPVLQERGGAIINVASTAAFQATPYLATYGASKAFVLNWSLALHEELRAHGVPVQALCPGPTRTNFFRNAGLNERALDAESTQDADAVVRASLRGLARGQRVVVPGWRNRLLVALAGCVPRTLAARASGAVLARRRLALVGGGKPRA